jgi:hypothetical protein
MLLRVFIEFTSLDNGKQIYKKTKNLNHPKAGKLEWR